MRMIYATRLAYVFDHPLTGPVYGGEVEVRAQLFVKSKPSVAWVDTKFEEIQDSLGRPYSPSQMNRLSSWPDAGAASPTRGEGVGRTSRAIRRRNR